MILNQFESSCIDCFDGNHLSQFGATNFLQTVMAPSPIVNIENNVSTITTVAQIHKPHLTTTNTPRKRHLSETDSDHVENKKMKHSSISASPSSHLPTSDNTHFNAIVQMISNLSDNFNSVASRLESRISEIEGNVEKRLTVKFSNVIHDKVKSEVGKLKDQISTEVNELKEKIVSLGKSYAEFAASSGKVITSELKDQHQLSVIVKNLPFDKREENDNSILKNKVSALSKDGLKLADINVAKVIRKTSRSDKKPGIVVITFATIEHKKGVLKAKRVLKNSAKYSRVYIENDLPLQKRINNNNNRTLLKILGRKNDFMIKSGRVVRKQPDDTSVHNLPFVNDQRVNNYPHTRNDRNRPRSRSTS
ncbi:unnamed protein product [Mytilus coruscus]|uniref:Uncharacterized protein n=1 Tax=Mytilus coruscus TaxID=42192 RepID=A0A6J8ELB1_MYTCO|nr:unnamed protein product [Mytilus coruscus]